MPRPLGWQSAAPFGAPMGLRQVAPAVLLTRDRQAGVVSSASPNHDLDVSALSALGQAVGEEV